MNICLKALNRQRTQDFTTSHQHEQVMVFPKVKLSSNHAFLWITILIDCKHYNLHAERAHPISSNNQQDYMLYLLLLLVSGQDRRSLEEWRSQARPARKSLLEVALAWTLQHSSQDSGTDRRKRKRSLENKRCFILGALRKPPFYRQGSGAFSR